MAAKLERGCGKAAPYTVQAMHVYTRARLLP